MRYGKRGRGFPGILLVLVILLIASSFFFHLFTPFCYGGYYPWHPFFFFGGFFIFKFILFIALLLFIGRRFFWGRRWAYDQFQVDYGPGAAWQGPYDRRWDRGAFQQRRHGKAPFEKAGNRATADFIELVSGFGSIEKKISSKNFLGGDVTTIMGHLAIDLRDADFNGTVRLKVTQIRGVTTIVVPKGWDVRAGEGTVFATYQDSQAEKTIIHPDKVLIIDGTCIMGGIEVRTS